MDIIDDAMLWRQFGAAIDMLRDALRDCPDDLWEKRLWEDQPDQWVAAGFSAFWYLGYHTLFWLDLYLTGAEEGFVPPAPFDWWRWKLAKSCREPIPVKNCSATWTTAAESVRRPLARCQMNRLTGCAGSPGESCLLRSFSFTICVMCRSTPLNCTCSWDNRRESQQGGYRRGNNRFHSRQPALSAKPSVPRRRAAGRDRSGCGS
jgi:hypothetical protein